MTYTKNNNDEMTVKLTSTEQHIMNNALMEYARNAYHLTGNIHHTVAAEKISKEFLDAYCDETILETKIINH